MFDTGISSRLADCVVRAAWFILLVGLLTSGARASSPTGQIPSQRFDHYSELARMETVIDRMYRTRELRLMVEESGRNWLESMIAADANADAGLLDTPVAWVGHTIDLEAEQFDVFVPKALPADGYGLLIYIPPTPSFRVPGEWRTVLAARGIVLVAPRNAGNGHPVMFRRIPLALHARENALQRYPVDHQRIYIGGWSGGSRVALGLALAYPDLFRGALLIAGSDPVDSGKRPMPNLLPDDHTLADQLRSNSRLVMLTGDLDVASIRRDTRTLNSMREAGLDGSLVRMPDTGHVLPDRRSLARALEVLDGPR